MYICNVLDVVNNTGEILSHVVRFSVTFYHKVHYIPKTTLRLLIYQKLKTWTAIRLLEAKILT